MSGVHGRWRALVAAGELKPDPAQEAVANRFDALATALEAPPPGLLGRLFGKARLRPRGLYLWGGVGRGKSMLMDLFVGSLAIASKHRVHFHAFMAETHARIAEARKGESGDPVRQVAEQLAADTRLLALDEMQVTNVADAMILSRLFGALLEAGTTIVTTSNRPPSDLYKDGLNRDLFLPFIALLETKLDVVALDGPTDYRLQRMGGMPVFYTPNGEAARTAMSELFFKMTDFPVEDRAHVPAATLALASGRSLHVPKSLKGVAVFSWKKLLAAPTGASDYLAIARTYHTVFLVGVPVMDEAMRNEASRFIAFVDALYDWRVKLILAADAPPDALYTGRTARFEFDRTVSRLIEMQSADYLADGHGIRETGDARTI
jgi:cell division protein ZapE